MKEKPKKTTERYLKIPYHILNIERLGLSEKVLLAHIYSFGEKGCWQSNETLGKIFMTSPRTIKRWLAKLIRANLVQIKSPKGYYRAILGKIPSGCPDGGTIVLSGQKNRQPSGPKSSH